MLERVVDRAAGPQRWKQVSRVNLTVSDGSLYPRSKSSVPWTISGYRASESGRLVEFWNPTFFAERRAALGVAPVLDDVATNQRENDSSPVLFQKAGDVINRKPMIHEKIADGQSPFRLGIEAYAIVGQRERLLIDTKTLSTFS